MGGRKTLISGRVISSGNIPPVSSKRARRSKVSDLNGWLRCLRRVQSENYLHSKSLGNARKVPNWFHGRFRGKNFNSGVCIALSAIGVK
jgi:hypothetical protein